MCQCSSPEHSIIVTYLEDDDYREVCLYIHLKKFPFFERLVHGIKYIFGHQSKYGEFDEIILRPADTGKIQAIADHLKKAGRQ